MSFKGLSKMIPLKRIAFDPKVNQYFLFERDENGICKKEIISHEAVVELYRNNVIDSKGEFMANGITYSLSAAPSLRTEFGTAAGLYERPSGLYYGDEIARQNLAYVGQKIRNIIRVKPLYDSETEMQTEESIPYPEARQEWDRLQKSFKWRFLKLCAWIDSWALGKEP